LDLQPTEADNTNRTNFTDYVVS